MRTVRRLELVSGPNVPEPLKLDACADDELMLLARGGSERAFEVLIRRHQQRALKLAARFLGGGSHAADATQATFVEIYRGLASYQARGRFTAYLYRVLLNQCRMVRRSARAELRARETSWEAPELDEQGMLTRERGRDVDGAVAQLSEKLRTVVLLRYSADLSYEEIASTLSIPVGTVKRRLFDAMAKLRAILEGK